MISRACFPGTALALLLAAGISRAQDAPAPAPPPKAPAEAPSPAAEPIPPPAAKEGTAVAEAGTTLGENRVATAGGQVVWYYTANFVAPATLKTELDQWKTPEAKIEPMANATGQAGNVLRIQERRENLPLLEKMLEILDRPQPQVLVKAKLVEITYTGSLEWGFETSYTAPGDTFFRKVTGTFNPDSYLSATAARPFQGGEVAFAFVGDSQSNYGSLDAVVRLLKSKGKAEILGEPNILATQGQKATIRAGEKVPVQKATVQGSTVFTNIDFQDTGITLEITPELIGRDAVRMKLRENVSAVSGFVTGEAGVQNPVINDRTAETTLTIRDGATLVVGGLQSSRTIENETGIPLLMDIPLLGWLFSTKSKQEVKTELYFIATPQIVRGSYSEGLILPPGEEKRLERLK
jgi:type II secretory pathway component GspD/PulD (secretin)